MTQGRIEGELIEQHRRLDALFAAVREGFASMHGGPALFAGIDRLQEALDVHFLQEEALYYPALWILRPELRGQLEACIAAHEDLRTLLWELEAQAERGNLDYALSAFESLAEDFRSHELREERVLHDLDREPAAPPEPAGGAG